MKKTILFLIGLTILASCRKEVSNTTKNDDGNLLTHKVTYSYIDTTTTRLQAIKPSKLQMFSASPVPG